MLLWQNTTTHNETRSLHHRLAGGEGDDHLSRPTLSHQPQDRPQVHQPLPRRGPAYDAGVIVRRVQTTCEIK